MTIPSPAQLDAILDGEGHAPCPGVDIRFNVPLGSVPGGPDLHATIYRPAARPADTPHAPALLALHGGGFQVGHPNGCGALAKLLALTLGVTTVSASYRLASVGHPTFPAVLDDVLHAYRWILAYSTELGVDPARVAVSGESAGAFLAAHLSVTSPWIQWNPGEPRPAALIAQWGPIDLVARWFDRGESPGAEHVLLDSDYPADPALYHRASPLAHARGPLPPALFLYGTRDATVHPRQGRLGHAAWQAAGARSELHLSPDIGHDVAVPNRAEFRRQLEAAAAFMASLA